MEETSKRSLPLFKKGLTSLSNNAVSWQSDKHVIWHWGTLGVVLSEEVGVFFVRMLELTNPGKHTMSGKSWIHWNFKRKKKKWSRRKSCSASQQPSGVIMGSKLQVLIYFNHLQTVKAAQGDEPLGCRQREACNNSLKRAVTHIWELSAHTRACQ